MPAMFHSPILTAAQVSAAVALSQSFVESLLLLLLSAS